MTYASALLLTLAIEGALALAITGAGARRTVLCSVSLANLLTHPLAAALLGSALAPLVAVEVGVVLVEALTLRLALGPSWRRALGLAGACNGATWALSYVV